MELCLGELVAPDTTGNMQVEGRSEQGGSEGQPESHKGLRIQPSATWSQDIEGN